MSGAVGAGTAAGTAGGGPAGGAVRVSVPATSANLGPGFDALGLALELRDVVVARASADGLRVQVEGEGADEVARDERHLVVRAMRAAFAAMGVQVGGLELSCTNRIPHGRGLGSSAAAIVAGVVAARALVSDGADRLDDRAALALASRIEGHPDNVAACLLGGLTIAWLDGTGDGADAASPRAVRLEPSPDLSAVVFVPADRLSTEAARGLLPSQVPHADAARNAGRAALLVEALTRRPALLLPATADRLHQPYRAAAMPASAALVDQLRRDGVPAVVSGAGPTVLALTSPDLAAALVATPRPGFTVHHLELAADGAGVVALA